MNLGLSPAQLRNLRRPETVLLLLILVVAVFWLFLDRQTGDAKLEASGIERNLRAARDDLRFSEENYNPAALERELEQLRSSSRPATLPSRQDALRFRNEILTYAAEQGLPLSTFEFSEGASVVAQGEYPIIRYSVVARGDLEPLVGALKLLREFPTATVQVLQFVRTAGEEGQWEMTIELDVFHQKAEV